MGNNSVTNGTGTNQDIIGVGDFAANDIHTSSDLIAIGDSPAENVDIQNEAKGNFIGRRCRGRRLLEVLTGSDLIGIGDSALQGSTGSTAMSNVVAIGGGAASELNASSGTNTEIIAIGDGT